ncbi:MAG: apolipoprotein N-acyltransferase [Lapillicoccus sp.]
MSLVPDLVVGPARLALALAAGASLCAAFPGYDLWVLAPVAVGLLALATCGARARTGFLLGLVTGLVFFGYSLSWAGIVVGAVPWAGLAASQALFMALLGAATAFLQGRGPVPRIRPGVVALAWVVQEALRDRVPYGGFPWVRLAFSQADSPFGRLAAVAGAPAVTFAVALAGGLLAAAVWNIAPRLGAPNLHAPHRARSILALGGTAAVLVAGFAVPLPTDGTPANVMAVQGNVPRPGLDFNAERRQVLDNHVTATEDAAAEVAAGTRPRPDLVVWPENSSDIDPTRNSDAQAQITRALDAIDRPLAVGTLLEQPAPDISNVVLLYEPGRGIVETYVKQHPVPFGEYIPNRDFFRRFSDKVDLVRADFAAGPGPVLFRVPAASGGELVAGPTICFEVAYDDLVGANVGLGANLLLVQTNNATFGYTAESVQQLAISRIRAMEHGRSIVHVSTVGVSALITPDGTVHQPSALFTRTVLSGSLPLRSARTVATMVGPWPEYAACLAFAVVMLAGLRRRPPTEAPTRIPAEPAAVKDTKEPHRG